MYPGNNNTKTDQLPISEVITGLPRPYHTTSTFKHVSLCIGWASNCWFHDARLFHGLLSDGPRASSMSRECRFFGRSVGQNNGTIGYSYVTGWLDGCYK